MADKVARFKQYEYRANSNLVLQAERTGPRVIEPTGEVESLRGRLGGAMGDRVQYGRPPEDMLAKMRKRAKENRKRENQIIKKAQKETVLSAKIDQSVYKPKTRENRAVYENILDILQNILIDQPSSVLESCVDELLYLYKKENLVEQERKREVLEILNITDKNSAEDAYTKLYHLTRQITDFVDDDDMEEGTEVGTDIALVFGEDDSGDEREFEIKDESEDEDDGAIDEVETNVLKDKGFDDEMETEEEENALHPRDIDAFWIKRKVSQFEDDDLQAQNIANEILENLKEENGGIVDCENNLVELLGYDHFDFVKLLLQHRKKILYCTLLKKAQNQDEIEKIRNKMKEDSFLHNILDILDGKIENLKSNQAILSRNKELRELKKQQKEDEKLSKKTKKNNKKSNNQDDDDDDMMMIDEEKNLSIMSRKIIDIENLEFHQGNHFMSNKVCELPENSIRQQKKEYDEVFIPALQTTQAQAGELVLIESLPEWAQLAFKKGSFTIKSLNRVQSKIFKSAFYEPDNLLICAPTGSGKTNCALLTMLHEIGLHRLSNGKIDLNNFKIIYIAPMKSLVREQVGEFSSRLSCYNITVKELSGDINLTKKEISETQIIFTTPEKWDIVTRKSGDSRSFTNLVRLMIIDEIHLLHDERGSVLESIIARTIRQIEDTQEMIRIVGLSATLPNYEDVATFCRVKPENVFAFDNSYRAVPLEQHYIGITQKKPLKKYKIMNDLTYEKVLDYGGEHQILVFVHSRKDTIKTAKMICERALEENQITKLLSKVKDVGRKILQDAAGSATSNDLKQLLPYGMAIHHAGMTRVDRTLVEDLYKEKYIQILVSTATLAWGVNLPARAVIIKGTEVYSPEKGSWIELSSMDVMQMIGRAGRPAYDDKGEGILITSNSELQFYLSLMNQQLPIESQFLKRLVDNLNAEIVMGSINNIKEAAHWLAYTYLYICMLRSPTLYGISFDEYDNDPELYNRRLDLVHSAAILLDKHNLIKYDRKSGNFQVTNLGRVASHFYIRYTSIAIYNEHLKPTTSDIDLFRLFSLSEEFKFITIRQEEKIELEKLLELVPIPIKEGIDEPQSKINVLLQAYISKLKLEGFAMAADMVYITQSAGRIMRALFGIVLQRGWAQLAERILLLCKMISRRMWPSQSPLRQLIHNNDIPWVIIQRIEGTNIPFERLYDLNTQELSELIHHKEISKKLFKKIHEFPRLELRAQVQPITPSMLKIDLTILIDFHWNFDIHGHSQGFWIFVEDVNGDQLLHHEYFLLKSKFSNANDEHYLSFTVQLFDPLPPQYFIKLISDTWIGPDIILPISFRHLILPAKYSQHTELLDLQPLPINALKNKKFQSFYENQFQYFNSIQTQCFNCFYNSNESALLSSPIGSGKTICAELAIFKHLKDFYDNENQNKIIYITAYESLAKSRYLDWFNKFSSISISVSILTGEINIDLNLLSKSDIIISTPEQWDRLSRLWTKRSILRCIGLFIIDDLHLISSSLNGHIIEVITSRMVRMSHLTEKSIRIIGLCCSIANAKSIAEWIGANSKTCFHFAPHTRPIPCEIHLKGFDDIQFEYRMLSMSKPIINSIIHHSNNNPVIIFSPSRQYVLKLANDIQIYCDSLEKPKECFLNCLQDDLNDYLKSIKNQFLIELLQYGIGIYHEHLNEIEKNIVERLFSAGAIQILIATKSTCWGMNLSSFMVIIQGTEYYDAKEHRLIDYPMADILQMIGRANRPSIDSSSKCFLFCNSSRKEFYKTFLFEALPIESHLDTFLSDHLLTEIFSTTVKETQEALDFLTWTFLYRRLTQNPNYYNLQGISHRHISDHLSELVESTLQLLEDAGCILIQNDDENDNENDNENDDENDKMQQNTSSSIELLNLGMISAHYYIKYDTIELFTSSLTKKTKLKGLLEILSNSKEFSDIPIRHKEPGILHSISGHLPVKIESQRFDEPAVKVNILLQSHFSRIPLKPDLKLDQQMILKQILNLLYGMVDVITTFGGLKSALCTMELAQMIVQGMWVSDSELKQLPFFDDEIIERCSDVGVVSIADITELEDDQRDRLLQLSSQQIIKVAEACNRYPDLEIDFQIDNSDSISPSENVSVRVALERLIDEDEDLGFVIAPYYPKAQLEQWWIVIGDQNSDTLFAVRKIQIPSQRKTVSISFTAPDTPGDYKYSLLIVCDSYIGRDLHEDLTFTVSGNPNESSDANMDED